MERKRAGRKSIRKRYAKMVSQADSERRRGLSGTDLRRRAESLGYSEEELAGLPESALMGLGCGNPTALAELKEGQIVLDLGSGAGLDVFLAARKVGPSGRVIGVDMTPEMLARAQDAVTKAGYGNVEFRAGEMENLPLADESVDVVISNCAVNNCPDKPAAFREAFRVLRPNGRMLISDLVMDGEPPGFIAPGLEVWREWLSVAVGKQEYLDAIRQAGFRGVEVVSERPYSGEAMHPALSGKITSLQIRARKQA